MSAVAGGGGSERRPPAPPKIAVRTVRRARAAYGVRSCGRLRFMFVVRSATATRITTDPNLAARRTATAH
eukprot:7381637-Prymnesium_polylepis.1